MWQLHSEGRTILDILSNWCYKVLSEHVGAGRALAHSPAFFVTYGLPRYGVSLNGGTDVNRAQQGKCA